jgi:hypothetical protein
VAGRGKTGSVGLCGPFKDGDARYVMGWWLLSRRWGADGRRREAPRRSGQMSGRPPRSSGSCHRSPESSAAPPTGRRRHRQPPLRTVLRMPRPVPRPRGPAGRLSGQVSKRGPRGRRSAPTPARRRPPLPGPASGEVSPDPGGAPLGRKRRHRTRPPGSVTGSRRHRATHDGGSLRPCDTSEKFWLRVSNPFD